MLLRREVVDYDRDPRAVAGIPQPAPANAHPYQAPVRPDLPQIDLVGNGGAGGPGDDRGEIGRAHL